ncbi:MAG TPA: RNAase, partial [bacterium]|nr:RNAase [bacterium]
MENVINRSSFFVKEHTGILKAANNYDILDPETNSVMMECREENLGIFTKLFRFTDYKRMTPFDVRIRTTDGRQVVRVTRGVSFFVSDVSVFDENDNRI